jgi:putative endonuclease
MDPGRPCQEWLVRRLAVYRPFFATFWLPPFRELPHLTGTMPSRYQPKPVAHWTDPRHVLGHEGEQAAIAFLEGRGWRIVARRFRLGHHDIDLVARKDRVVAFVEVKTRTSHRFGSPLQALGHRQRLAQTKVATVWIDRHGRGGDEYRFDLVIVDLTNPAHPRVEQVEDAWRAGR